MKLLVTKLSSFGDVIAAFPAVTDAVSAGHKVDWLVDASLAHVVALHPGVGTIHSLEGRASRSLARLPGWFSHSGEVRRALKGGGYDRVVDLQGLLKSALPSRWAGAKTHGYDARSIREPFASAFYDVRHAVSWSLHAVERNRALMAAALGAPAPTGPAVFGLSTPPRAAESYGVILHSASWDSKLWPEARWRELLAARTDLPFRIPWGDEAERARAERLAAGLSHVSVLAERLTRDELAAFLAGARVVIGLDTGLMHLAHALGAPTIWLFGSTSPERTGPHGPGAVVLTSTVPAAPCMRRECRHEGGDCMEGVAVSAVLEALEERLAPA